MATTDLTPKYPLIPMKEKVVLAGDVEVFGQTLGGMTANATSVQQGSGNEIYKFDYRGLWLGAAEFEDAPFSVSMEGDITGAALTVSQIDIPDTISGNSFHVDSLGNMWSGKTTLTNAPFSVLNTGDVTATSIIITGGTIDGITLTSLTSGSEIAIQGWTHDMVFSITDLNTVAWASGTITLMNGDTYSIDAGNTGNMSAETYVYLDIGTSITVLQTTTTKTTAVGSGKIMIAIAEDGTVEPTFTVFGSDNQNLNASDIVSNSITANEITANTITATEMNISQLSAIAADLGTITAGSISVVAGGNTIGLTPSGGNAIFSGTTGSPEFAVTPAGVVTASNITITGGAISGVPISGIPNSAVTDISILELTHNLVFSVTDADTIAWAGGTITMSNGRAFSIDAGNTGNMAALTYIYLDPDTSATVLQTTTTYSTAIGADKALIGTAQNQTITASFIPQKGGGEVLVDGSQIGALSIIAGNIAASTITAGKLNVSTLSAITANVGTLTSGTITGLILQTDAGATAGIKMDSTSLRGYDGSNNIVFSLATATGIISSVGMEAKAIKTIESFTAGENITDGEIVCLKPGFTDIQASDDSYVDSANVGTNFGSNVALRLDVNQEFRVFIKFDMTSVVLPNRIVKAELRMKRFEFVGGTKNLVIRRVDSADWNEGAITWTNMPTTVLDVEQVYGMEDNRDTGANPTFIVWDITQLVRHWKDGNVNNYGIEIRSDDTNLMSFDSSETADSAERPVLRIYDIQDSDGEVYLANCSDYQLSRAVIGVAQETISDGNAIEIQTAGIADNMGGAIAGGTMYLNNVAGDWVDLTTNLNRIIKLGKTTAAGKAGLDFQAEDILIEKFYDKLSATTSAQRFYVPSDARRAVIHIDGSANLLEKVFYISRDADGLISYVHTEAGASPPTVSIVWDVANNYLTITLNKAGAYIKNLYFYT